MKKESQCTLRYARTSWRKAGQVVDLVRGKRADKALEILAFTNKTAMPMVAKLIKSCMAHFGKHVTPIEFVISEIYVGQGPSMKRFRPGAMGRAAMFRKKTCHITLKLTKI